MTNSCILAESKALLKCIYFWLLLINYYHILHLIYYWYLWCVTSSCKAQTYCNKHINLKLLFALKVLLFVCCRKSISTTVFNNQVGEFKCSVNKNIVDTICARKSNCYIKRLKKPSFFLWPGIPLCNVYLQ